MKAIVYHNFPSISEKKSGYSQGEEITDPYDLSEAIGSIFMAGFDVMLTHSPEDDSAILCVDEKGKRFRQR